VGEGLIHVRNGAVLVSGSICQQREIRVVEMKCDGGANRCDGEEKQSFSHS
jgi:hypothetical protein